MSENKFRIVLSICLITITITFIVIAFQVNDIYSTLEKIENNTWRISYNR